MIFPLPHLLFFSILVSQMFGLKILGIKNQCDFPGHHLRPQQCQLTSLTENSGTRKVDQMAKNTDIRTSYPDIQCELYLFHYECLGNHILQECIASSVLRFLPQRSLLLVCSMSTLNTIKSRSFPLEKDTISHQGFLITGVISAYVSSS